MKLMMRAFRWSRVLCGVSRVGSNLAHKHGVRHLSMEGVLRCSANDVPLTPISFIERAALVYRDTTSLVFGDLIFTWQQTRDRCRRLASALTQLGISRLDVVAVLSPNVPAMYELHFGVPMMGGVLCTLNTRYDSNMVAHLLKHSGAKIIFVDHQLLELAHGAFDLLSQRNAKPPLLVLISESKNQTPTVSSVKGSSDLEYEKLLEMGCSDFEIKEPKDEWDPISLNYTSGTTSSPKGVVYNHRGAYLNTLATILFGGVGAMPVYLWTVPMFHCNGWCLAWGMAAQGGTNICFRKVAPKAIFDQIAFHKVTHMGGAPTVLNMIVNAPASDRRPLPGRVKILTGGAPPPSQILSKMEELGFNVTHLYGLTETYGPAVYSMWKPEWNSLSLGEQAKLKSRQGLHHLAIEVDVKNPTTLDSVPPDGTTMGEVMFRGNTVMSGYFKDVTATQEAFKGGYFRTGDLAVKHPDGYIELKDRSKDIIISGGENICSIEVEMVLYSHPAIFEAAVVARPDNIWGETPCAFVKLKEGCNADADEIIKFCRERLSHYMAPRSVVFEDIPRTSTGKVQKFLLRERAKALGSIS